MLEARRLGLWVEHYLCLLKAEHISAVTNIQADWLSWQMINHVEWHLHPSIFQRILEQFSLLKVDLFAMQQNAQLPAFMPDSQSCGGGEHGHTLESMVSGSPLCLSIIASHPEGGAEDFA